MLHFIFKTIFICYPTFHFLPSNSEQDINLTGFHNFRPDNTMSMLDNYFMYPEFLFRLSNTCVYWRVHQTSPTVVSLKGRLLQKFQSKSTLSCEIVQIHSLFRHGFIKKPKVKV